MIKLVDDFFELRPKQLPNREIEAIDEENISFKSIRPNRTYESIKKKYYQNERKRKFEEFKKQREEEDAQKLGVGMYNHRSGGKRPKYDEITQSKPKQDASLNIKTESVHSDQKHLNAKGEFQIGYSSSASKIKQQQSQGSQAQLSQTMQMNEFSQMKEQIKNNSQSMRSSQQKSERISAKEKQQMLSNLYIQEIRETVDSQYHNDFKKLLKEMRENRVFDPIFSNQSIIQIELFDKCPNPNAIHAIQNMMDEVQNYEMRKRVSIDTAQYINRIYRERYLEITRLFYKLYEEKYPPQKGLEEGDFFADINPKKEQDEEDEEILCSICYFKKQVQLPLTYLIIQGSLYIKMQAYRMSKLLGIMAQQHIGMSNLQGQNQKELDIPSQQIG
ncbi:UNKNOWN [Stylonychia lemnae]|uniref:Uncharacterized protein n=1 Tax=Stylonychia lemnae TaxID=5949 RepID=A0A078A6M9_STYLE|nr:UNKNOWN [Stylonychia lemnae]|eukprot:CDW77536.1 UNKNOWN [Stylonychia lemnae]